MKILRVIPSVDPAAGGPIEGLLNSSRQLRERGHHIDVVSLDLPDAPCTKAFQFPLYSLGQSRRTYGFSPRCRNWLNQHVNDYDVVIIQGIWQYHAVAAANACRRHKVPYVVFTHGMLDPWFKRTYPLKHLKKLPYWFLLLRGILRDARAVVFTTDAERQLARQSFPCYRCNEMVVSYGTTGQQGDTNTQRDAFLSAWPQLHGRPFCLFLSRIHPKKGVDIIIDAFARAYRDTPDQWLVIAGPDETGLQAALQAQAKRLGIADRVLFPGLLQGDNKWGAYAAADCFVLPSHQENFGIVVAEALSAGLPVLISDQVNIYHEILACRAGLVSADNSTAFAALLGQWRQLADSDKAAMRLAARQCFLQHFAIDAAAQSLEKVLINATT